MDWAAIIQDFLNNLGMKNLYWWFVGLSAILFHKDAITRYGIFYFIDEIKTT